ncbi:MAG: hypothetical protein LBM39_02185 [Candidatus Methanoplasma sp.]|jgi:hypothetical protein|nr:hypothetical protein [Candidatus Methanoplasma sp.]
MAKGTIIAVIVVVVVVIAAAGAFFLLKGDDSDPDRVTFLVQDDEGVYFWIEGSGETVQDAFVDAFSAYPKGTLETSPYGISTLFGVGTTQDPVSNNYSWWGQFSWEDDAWTYNATASMPGILSKDTDYFLVIYGEGTMDGIVVPAGTATPKDAKVWDGSTKGTVFTIASSTGLYFKINGSSSESLIKAFNEASAKYNVPLVNTESIEYGQGIDSLFGLGMDQDAEGNWLYWAQYGVNAGAWEATVEGMSSLKSADYPKFLVQYNGDPADIPV